MAKLPRDGDSDGRIFDGTKREMPAPTKLVEVAEKVARAVDDVDDVDVPLRVDSVEPTDRFDATKVASDDLQPGMVVVSRSGVPVLRLTAKGEVPPKSTSVFAPDPGPAPWRAVGVVNGEERMYRFTGKVNVAGAKRARPGRRTDPPTGNTVELYRGTDHTFTTYKGLSFTDDALAAEMYGRPVIGGDGATITRARVSLDGLKVKEVEVSDDDWANGIWPGDDGNAHGADVLVYDDDDPNGRHHQTWRFMSDKAIARLAESNVRSVGVDENGDPDFSGDADRPLVDPDVGDPGFSLTAPTSPTVALSDPWPTGPPNPNTGWRLPLDDVTLPGGRRVKIVSHGGDSRDGYYSSSYVAFDADSGGKLGYLDYQLGHGELHIGMVSTNDDVRGEGVADALLGRTLADADPGSTVFSGYKTDEGAGWWDHVAPILADRGFEVGDPGFALDALDAPDAPDAGGERLDPLSITRSGNPVRWKEGGWQWVKGDASQRTIDARMRAVRALMEDELPQLKGKKFTVDTWLNYDEFHADHPYGGDVAPVAGWRPKLGEHGTLFVSPEVTRGLSYNDPEAVRDWRIIMHELVHAASPQTVSNSGPEPVMEEGMAEILSTDIAARRLDLAGFASDGRHGRSKWTGMEGLAAGANYKDRVAALIMNAGQRTGWDRDATRAMLRDWWDGGTYSPYFRRIERRDDGLDPDAFAAKRRDEIIARYNDLIARLPEHADEYEADRARKLGDVSTLEGDWRWQSNQEWEKGVESARSHGVDVDRIPFDYTNEPYWDLADSREVVAERDTVGASLLYWLLDGSDGRTAETATTVEAPTTEHPTGDRFGSLADAAGAGKVTVTDADVKPGMVTVDNGGDPLLHIQAPGDKPDTWVAVDGAGGGRTYRLPGTVDVAAMARSDDPGAALAADAALRGPWRRRRPVSARRRSQAFNLLNEVQAAPMADEPLVAAPDPDVFDGADLKPGDRFDVPVMSAVQADGAWPTRTGGDHTAGLAEWWARLDPEKRGLLDSGDVEQMGARMAPEPRTVLRFDTSRALPGEGGSHTVTGRFVVDGVEDVEDPDGLPYWDGAGFRQSPARVVRAHWVEDVDAPDGRGPVATPPGWTRQGPPVLDDWTTREPVGGWASEADRIRAAQTWPTGSQAVTFTLGDGDGRVDMVVHEPWQIDQQKLAQLGSTVATLQRSFQPPVPSRMKAPVRPVTVDVTPFPGGEQAAAVTWPDDRRIVYDWSALKPGSRADVMTPPWTVRNATRVDDVDYIATHEWGHLVDPEGKWSTKASLRKPVSGYARSAMNSYRAQGGERRRRLGAENWAEMFADWAINPETADPESQEVVGQAGFPVPVPPIADLPPGGGLPGEADGGLPGGAGAVVAAVAAGPSWPGDIVVDRFDGRPVDERLVADAYLILGLTPPSANMPASTDDEGADSGRRTDRPAGPNPARRGQDDQAVEGHDRRGDRRPVEGAVQPDEVEAPARRAGVTIAGEEPTGAMVALVPARPQALTVDGGEELGALHLTLKFLGDAVDWPADQRAVVERTVADWAAQTPGFTGTVGGAGRLGTAGAMVWHLDVPGLARSREALSAWIDDRTDADTSDRWDGFTPHVTFAYDDVDLPDLPDGDVPFFDAVVCWGPDRTVVPLSGTLGRSAAVLARDGDGDGFIYDGTKREMLAPTRMLDIDIDMELEADAIGERRNAPIGRVQPVTRGSDVAPKPAVDADFGAMRDDAPATKSGKKAARPGGKALIAATLGDRIGAKNGTVAGVRHIETAEEAVRQFVGNLEVVYQAAKKRKGFIAGARQWYDRAHDRAVALADKLDMHPDGGAAVLAALSPNMDWNYNLAQADALAEFWSTDPVVDDEVRKLARRLVSDLRFKDYKHRLPGDPMKPESKWITLVDVPEGTRLRSGITDPQTRAIYARVWATLHTEGGAFSPELRVDSNGQMVPTGAVPRTRWQKADNIAKALAIMDDPSRANVDRQLGDGLKVRSFYNNIAYPDNNGWPGGDVTVDTHAASTLFGAPYGNKTEPFATIVGKSTVEDGEYIKVAMVEAFRRFAAKHADDFDTPREAQSALWEIWRSAAYSNAGNNEALKQGLRDAWAAVDEPGISDAVRRRRRRKARQLMGEWLSRPLPWIDYDPTKVDADGNPVSPVEEVPDAPTV